MARCHLGCHSVELRLMTGAVLAVDPARITVLVVLLLPDRHPVLDLVDDVAAGIEGLAAMGGADPDPDRQLADRQRPEPVRAAGALDTEALPCLGKDALALAHCQRLETVVLPPQHHVN